MLKRAYYKIKLLVWPWVTWDKDPLWREKVAFDTRSMLAVPKIFFFFVRKMPCGCSRNIITRNIVLYNWRCPEDHGGMNAWREGLDG